MLVFTFYVSAFLECRVSSVGLDHHFFHIFPPIFICRSGFQYRFSEKRHRLVDIDNHFIGWFALDLGATAFSFSPSLARNLGRSRFHELSLAKSCCHFRCQVLVALVQVVVFIRGYDVGVD